MEEIKKMVSEIVADTAKKVVEEVKTKAKTGKEALNMIERLKKESQWESRHAEIAICEKAKEILEKELLNKLL